MAFTSRQLDKFLLLMILRGKLSPQEARPYLSGPVISLLDELAIKKQFEDMMNGGNAFGQTLLGGREFGNSLGRTSWGDRGGELKRTSFYDRNDEITYESYLIALGFHLAKHFYDRHEDNQGYTNQQYFNNMREQDVTRFTEEYFRHINKPASTAKKTADEEPEAQMRSVPRPRPISTSADE